MRRWMLVLVALAGLSSPARLLAADLTQTCVNNDVPFAVRIPAGWWVHPVDPERDISECEHFGPVPFKLTKDEDGVLTGSTIGVHVVDACVGHFRDIVSRQEINVAGLPTTRIELAASEGDPTPGPATTLLYWIHLRGEECEASDTRYIVAATGSTDPQRYAQDAAVLDAMMASFALGMVPDGAMSTKGGWGLLHSLGLGLMVAAFTLARPGRGRERREGP